MIMIKKLIIPLTFLMIGMIGISAPVKASTTIYATTSGEVTEAEKMMVCCKLDEDRVLSLETAIQLMRQGQLTITKIDTGIYRVVTPGGTAIADLLDDNI